MVRMRLVSEAYQEIKAADPNTALTMCALRRLVNSGAVPTVTSGRKKLVNLDVLLAYLDREGQAAEPSPDGIGQVRPIQPQ